MTKNLNYPDRLPLPCTYLCWTHLERTNWSEIQPPTCRYEQLLQLLPLPLLNHSDTLLISETTYPLVRNTRQLLKMQEGKNFPLPLLPDAMHHTPLLKSFAWNKDLYAKAKRSGYTPVASWRSSLKLTEQAVTAAHTLNSKDFLQTYYSKSPHLNRELSSATFSTIHDILAHIATLEQKQKVKQDQSWRLKPLFSHAGRQQMLISQSYIQAMQGKLEKLKQWLTRCRIDASCPVGVIEENKERYADVSTFWEILPLDPQGFTHQNNMEEAVAPEVSINAIGYSLSHVSSQGKYLGGTLLRETESVHSCNAPDLSTQAQRMWAETIYKHLRQTTTPSSNDISKDEILTALASHLKDLVDPSCNALFSMIVKSGYIGPVTIDAYFTREKEQLHSNQEPALIILPCDLNARMSFGRIMLEVLFKEKKACNASQSDIKKDFLTSELNLDILLY